MLQAYIPRKYILQEKQKLRNNQLYARENQEIDVGRAEVFLKVLKYIYIYIYILLGVETINLLNSNVISHMSLCTMIFASISNMHNITKQPRGNYGR